MTVTADLADRADVAALLYRFYGAALHDEVLYEPFAQLRASGLRGHIPKMCDFWETVLFRAGLYKGSALTVHRDLHNRTPLTANHFARWLALWQQTVDEMYAGPVAERAKVQAARIAWAMNRRLNGNAYEAVSLPPGAGSNEKRRPVTSDGTIRT